MKVSDVIKRLQKLKIEYGDLPVSAAGEFGDIPIQRICVYDDEGNSPDRGRKPFEIFLH